MTKGQAISKAVDDQIVDDGRDPQPYEQLMGANLHYVRATMCVFLARVKARLAEGRPAYEFKFAPGFCTTALSYSVARLKGAVGDRTEP